MTINQLIAIANDAYPDDLILQYHKEPKGHHGDTLAKFIACGLRETCSDATTEGRNLLAAALRAMENARERLDSVVAALQEAATAGTLLPAADPLASLRDTAAALGVTERTPHLLDEAVHEAKAREAADINNAGLDAQLQFLFSDQPLDAAVAHLKSIVGTP